MNESAAIEPMKFSKKGVEFIAKKAYPNGLRGECRNPQCPLYMRGKDCSQSDYVQWVVSENWPRCKKCDKRIEVEAIKE